MFGSNQIDARFTSVATLVFISLSLVVSSFAQRPPTAPINFSYLRVDFLQPGARPAGLGGAFIGAAQDETAAAINPAGLTYLRSTGASLHQRPARFNYEEPQGSPENPDGKAKFRSDNFDQNMVSVFLPLETIKPLRKTPLAKVHLAVFRQVVFDSRFNFETEQFLTTHEPLSPRQLLGGLGNFPGRKVTLDLEMVSDAFSIAFPLTKRVSIGLTGKSSVLNFRLNETTFLDPALRDGNDSPQGNIAQTTYSLTSVDERHTEMSFSIGIMAKLILDKLFFGAVYNSNPTFRLKSTIFLPAYSAGEQRFDATSPENTDFNFSVPDTYGFGLYYIASSRLRFMADIMRIEYSDLLSDNYLNWPADDLFSSPQQTFEDTGTFPDLTVEDATEFHFGVEIVQNVPKLGVIPFRFGVFNNPGHRIHAVDSSPDMQRLFPKAKDRLGFSFGVGIVLSSYLKFDTSLVATRDGFEVYGSTLLTLPL